MNPFRRQLVLGTATLCGLSGATALAQDRLAMNVSISFPPPLPDTRRLRAHMAQHFSGNVVSEGMGSGRKYDGLPLAATRVAAGPQLDGGQSVYALLVQSDQLLYEPLVDQGGAMRGKLPSPERFRPAYMLGDMPLALCVGRAVSVSTMDELAVLARSRAASGRALDCQVASGYPAALANRLARLMSASLMRTVSPFTPHAHHMAEDPRTELFLAPLSHVMLGRAEERKLKVVAVLAPPTVVRRALLALGAKDDLADRPVGGAYEGLAIQPTTTLFVSRDEKDGVVRRLHAAWAAAFAEPEPPLSGHLVLEGHDQFGSMTARFERDRQQLEDLVRRA